MRTAPAACNLQQQTGYHLQSVVPVANLAVSTAPVACNLQQQTGYHLQSVVPVANLDTEMAPAACNLQHHVSQQQQHTLSDPSLDFCQSCIWCLQPVTSHESAGAVHSVKPVT